MIIYINSTYDQKAEEDMKLLVKKQKKKNTLLKEVIKYMKLLIFKFQNPPPLWNKLSFEYLPSNFH